TDFGLQDHYAGAMKGAILSACPGATLVDITHEVPAHDVAAGALALDAAYRHFPAGTVFVTVVDPGVGSERRPIAVRAGRWLFVGPDNGLFTYVLEADPAASVRLIADARLFHEPTSPVFHGRDLFGPVAACLAGGLPLEAVGPAVTDPVRLEQPPKTRTADGWEGVVLHVDRFGNLTTNLLEGDLAALAEGSPEGLEVGLGPEVLPLVRAYSDVEPGRACALVGSSGRLEIAVRLGRGGALPGAAKGARVRVHRRAGGVLHSRAR
ncbi:MAG TPA: SAM-dependent chlorinase/fluorinase, partial [Vicinamibacteria bacterium]|nr:SAM-dependent chlorinase/fluorinase [Vicinamibacteria bacterium]